MRSFSFSFLIIASLLAMLPLHVLAASDEMATSNLCSRHFAQYEKNFNIPDKLLQSISLVESGIGLGKGTVAPWPWTINAQGKGYYFKTKAEAINAARKFQQNGQRSIDVGCMQINLYYHPKAFQNLEEAFEPHTNIAYAASFLQNNYSRYNNWQKAVASYHSETDSLGHPYAQKVLSVWKKAPGTSYASTATFSQSPFSHSSSFRQTGVSYLSPRMKARRNSNLMITVRNAPSVYGSTVDTEKVNMVENVTQNALRNFNQPKAEKAVMFVD